MCASCTHADLTDENSWTARAALRWVPDSHLTVDLTGDYSNKNNLPIGRRLAYSINNFPPYDASVAILWGVPPSAFQNTRINARLRTY